MAFNWWNDSFRWWQAGSTYPAYFLPRAYRLNSKLYLYDSIPEYYWWQKSDRLIWRISLQYDIWYNSSESERQQPSDKLIWWAWFDTLHMVLMTTKTWGHDWSEIILQFCSVPNLDKLTRNNFTQLFFLWNGFEHTHTQKHTLSKPNGTLNHSEIRTHKKWHINI